MSPAFGRLVWLRLPVRDRPPKIAAGVVHRRHADRVVTHALLGRGAPWAKKADDDPVLQVHVPKPPLCVRLVAIFGVLNTALKPLLRLVTLPLAILTLGIAWFFVSLLMLVITNAIVSGFYIDGFWTFVEATLMVWAVNMVLDLAPGPWQITGARRRRYRRRVS